MRLLITRPEEDAQPLAAALAARGIETLTAPMMVITPVAAPGPELADDLENAQAVLISSANGARALARCHPGRDIAVYAVGDASAGAAREIGFAPVYSAAGDVAALAALVIGAIDPTRGPLLHVAASDVSGDLGGALAKAGFEIVRHVLYAARAVAALDADAKAALKAGTLDGVLLFSPRTAAIFTELVAKAGLVDACGDLTAYCLSPAVADRAGAIRWGAAVVAPQPTQDALLALISGR